MASEYNSKITRLQGNQPRIPQLKDLFKPATFHVECIILSSLLGTIVAAQHSGHYSCHGLHLAGWKGKLAKSYGVPSSAATTRFRNTQGDSNQQLHYY